MIAHQLLRHCVRLGVMQSHCMVPVNATWIGEKSPSPTRIPKDAFWRLPVSFSRIFIGVFVVIFLMLWIRSRILFVFQLVSEVCNIGH